MKERLDKVAILSDDVAAELERATAHAGGRCAALPGRERLPRLGARLVGLRARARGAGATRDQARGHARLSVPEA
jgi:hypothetical protein